jgi:CRP-like cAMP-binding protein
VLNITENDLKTYYAVKLMVEGDHVGEIGLLYKCKRSASVVSRNYNVMARLSSGNFRAMALEYPEYKKTLKKHVIGYKYHKKTFILRSLK